MKRLLAYIVFAAALSVTARAQSGSVAEGVAKIRAAYTEAQQMMQQCAEDVDRRNKVEIVRCENVPGGGPVELRVEMFFKNTYDDESPDWENARPQLYFIRVKHRVAAVDYFKEFLLDKDSGELLFYYAKTPDPATGRADELRYYLAPADRLQFLRKIENGKTTDKPAEDAVFILREFDQYKQLFAALPPYDFD